jgi:hypothetical protein
VIFGKHFYLQRLKARQRTIGLRCDEGGLRELMFARNIDTLVLKRLAYGECSNAKEEHKDRAYAEETPLPNVNKSWAKHSEVLLRQRMHVRRNRSGQTLNDEKFSIRIVI